MVGDNVIKKDLTKKYSKLYQYYDNYIDNFGFTQEEFEENMNDIFNFMKEAPQYFILYQKCDDYDIEWFLTSWIE